MYPDEELCLPESCRSLTPEEYVGQLVSFLELYRTVADIHIVHFITHNQWDLIDLTWQDALLPNDPSHEAWVTAMVNLAASTEANEAWPDSLKEYVQLASTLALPRVPPIDIKTCDLDRRIRLGMTEKKKHEVAYLSALIAQVAQDHDIHKVVDLGAGQGYLSRALAFQNGLQVLALDGSEVQTCGAKKFDARAIKHKTNIHIHHTTEMIGPDNASSLLTKYNVDSGDDRWLVCGLHACGDLSSLMLRLFARVPQITSVVNVGCCYHFLSETDEGGFPMSKALAGYRLGSIARMLACQAPCRWADKREETLESFEHHFFRALLQWIMVEKGLAETSTAPTIGRLNKKKDFVSFPVYVQAALKRLGLPHDAISVSEAEAYYAKGRAEQVDKKIAILWTLRTLLAPIIESIVLVDRWLSLKEALDTTQSATKGVWMWPLFDPVISPRNVVIVATK